MADQHAFTEWGHLSPLGTYLRDVLPADYLVVTELKVFGHPLEAVVVGPPGLCVLYPKDWAGEIRPARRRPWREKLKSGHSISHPNPADEARQAEKALAAFLRDEFPSLRPTIRHMVVLTDAGARVKSARQTVPPILYQDEVAEVMTVMRPAPHAEPLDEDDREDLAEALCERELTVSQRAAEPFVFRSGGRLSSGKRVWTISAAIQHMDKNPEDGIFHLRNGTLAGWLSEQGAEHMAELAREAVREGMTDPRIPLETFLIKSGLVRRPRLSVKPARLSFGSVLSGENCTGRLRVKKGRGRGYLFGTLHTTDPWLHVEPHTISDGALEARVTADASSLPISARHWQTGILVDSSASEEPVAVPVSVRVVATPSRLNRTVLRPLASATTAGLLGVAIGWALGTWGLAAPEWFAGGASWAGAWPAACALVVGFVWAILGWYRGINQPAAWSTSYALGRWLLEVLAWGAGLGLVVGLGHLAFRRFVPDWVPGAIGVTTSAVVLLAVALSVIPAGWSEIRAGKRVEGQPAPLLRRALRRPLIFSVAGIVAAILLAAGFRVMGPGWQEYGLDEAAASAQDWTAEHWAKLEDTMNGLVDKALIEYYDTRATAAPTATPFGTVLPSATPEPNGTPTLMPLPTIGSGAP